MSATTVGSLLVSHYGFRLCDYGARLHGKIDQKTDH
jgi:hypothetical protein